MHIKKTCKACNTERLTKFYYRKQVCHICLLNPESLSARAKVIEIKIEYLATRKCIKCDTKSGTFYGELCSSCSRKSCRNPERDYLLAKEYRLKNKDIMNAKRNIRRSLTKSHSREETKRKYQKLKAIPKYADLKMIEQIYRNTPEGFQVDHIIPLIHKDVCGLHVEANLQYLKSSENASKRNDFDYTYDNGNWRIKYVNSFDN